MAKFLWILFTLGWCILNSQQHHQQEINKAFNDFNKENGDLLFKKIKESFNSNFDSCIFYSNRGIELFNELEDWEKLVDCYNFLAAINYYKRDYKKFKTISFKAIDVSKELLDPSSSPYQTARNNIGGFYKLLGDFDKGISNIVETLDIPDTSRKAAINRSYLLQNLAMFYKLKGDNNIAVEQIDQAISLLRDTIPTEKQRKYVLFVTKAFFMIQNGKIKEALALLNECEREFLFSLNSSNGTVKKHLIDVYKNFVRIYKMKANYDLMEKYLSKLDMVYSNGFEYQKFWNYKIRGEALLQQQKLKGAIVQFRNANSFLVKWYDEGEGVSVIAESYFKLAEGQFINNQLDDALKNIQLSFRSLSSNFISYENIDNPSLEVLPKRDLTLQILITKSDILFAMSEEKNWEEESLTIALDQYQYLSNFLTLLRYDLLSLSAKQLITEKIHTQFEKAIEVSLKLYNLNKDPKYLEQAYHFAEQNKAITLQDAIQENLAKGFGGIPDSTLEKEKDMRVEIAFYEKMIYEEELKGDKANEEHLSGYKEQLFALEREYEQLVKQLENDYPKYHELKYKTSLPSVADIQNQIKEGEALIEYFVGEKNIFAFVFTKTGLEVVEMPKLEDLAIQIETFRDYINQAPGQMEDVDFQKFAELGNGLFHQILEEPLTKLGDAIRKLIIVPDDVLTYIPFEVLMPKTPEKDGINYSLDNLSYLFEDYQIGYSSSSALWLKNMSHVAGKGSKTFLGFAPTFGRPIADASRDCTSDELYSLNCNEGEIDAIRHLIGGEMLAGLGAEKAGFEQMVPEYQILHLATHACVDDEDPMFNKIWLSDDYVSNHDLYNLQLNADLAVLSACNTGSGKLVKGEGVQSLARGFLHAGCPSLVTSLWSVDDCATSDIMVHFYKHLKEGESKDKALQLAKLDYLKSADKLHQHPYYWAAFVQIGNSEPLELNASPKWWVFGGLVVLLAGFWFLRRRRIV